MIISARSVRRFGRWRWRGSERDGGMDVIGLYKGWGRSI